MGLSGQQEAAVQFPCVKLGLAVYGTQQYIMQGLAAACFSCTRLSGQQ